MLSALLIAALWLAVEPLDTETGQKAPEPKEQSAARLKLMKETAARIEIRVEEKEGARLTLSAEPVLRWDNHRSFVVDAATFVWLARRIYRDDDDLHAPHLLDVEVLSALRRLVRVGVR
ncbi:MAG: hypothetical protein HY290_06785 [Planctomycetia bacterium]|nr:hypothetical protein [Planctomycetia bacterium]